MSDLPVYVVIGAAGGIGSEVSRRLYEKGCNLMMGARHVEELDTIQADLPDALYFCVFAEQIEDVVRCAEHAMNMWGHVDGIVYCDGSTLYKMPHQTEEDEWKNLIAFNLSAAFACVHAGGKLMLENGGSIVLLSSALATQPAANSEAMAAAAGGIAGLVKSAAETYKPFNIRINAVAPGVVNGDNNFKPDTKLPDGFPSHEAADVAKVLAWLAGSDCSETGEILSVDEGLAKLE